jgi:hypothetical protein
MLQPDDIQLYMLVCRLDVNKLSSDMIIYVLI